MNRQRYIYLSTCKVRDIFFMLPELIHLYRYPLETLFSRAVYNYANHYANSRFAVSAGI